MGIDTRWSSQPSRPVFRQLDYAHLLSPVNQEASTKGKKWPTYVYQQVLTLAFAEEQRARQTPASSCGIPALSFFLPLSLPQRCLARADIPFSLEGRKLGGKESERRRGSEGRRKESHLHTTSAGLMFIFILDIIGFRVWQPHSKITVRIP